MDVAVLADVLVGIAVTVGVFVGGLEGATIWGLPWGIPGRVSVTMTQANESEYTPSCQIPKKLCHSH